MADPVDVHLNGGSKQVEPGAWTIHGERTLYDNPWIRLIKVDVEPPDGKRFEHHVVRLNEVSVALVLNEADEALMLWRHRFVTDQWGWELPGGIVDEGEDALSAAGREVEEETGWRPTGLRHLLTFQPMIGMVDSPHHLFLAEASEHIGDPTDAQEAGRVDWVPMAQVIELMAKGEILGSGSLVALLYVLAERTKG